MTAGDTYYIRATLFNGEPTGFYLKATVNSEEILSVSDTAIDHLQGVSVVQVNNLNGPCTLQATYSGPSSLLYFYPPGTDVQQPTNSIANGTSTFSVSPTEPGNYYISIKHGINETAITLDPFTLTI